MTFAPKDPFYLYSLYYDLMYQDKAYELEADFIINRLKEQNPTLKSLLELGSGTGNYSSEFCKKGFTVCGIEKSHGMVTISEKKQLTGFTPIVGDMKNFSLNQQFDAAVALFHVISYLTSNEDLINCFRNIAKHLHDKGLFFFDIWYSPAVNAMQPEQRVKQVENETHIITRHANSVMHVNENIVDVDFEIIVTDKIKKESSQIKEIHRMRHFSTPELELIANASGFKLIHSEEFLTGNSPSLDSWGVCYMIQKI